MCSSVTARGDCQYPFVSSPVMCDICDGATPAEALASFQQRISEYGWAMQSVVPNDGAFPWTYTVGLIKRFNHPELIIVGLPDRVAAHVLHGMVGEIDARGVDYRSHESVDLRCGCHFHINRVHPNRLGEDWFNTWLNVYADDDDPPAFEALQLTQCCHPDGLWLPFFDRAEVHYPILDDATNVDWDALGTIATRRRVNRRPPRGGRGRPRGRPLGS